MRPNGTKSCAFVLSVVSPDAVESGCRHNMKPSENRSGTRRSAHACHQRAPSDRRPQLRSFLHDSRRSRRTDRRTRNHSILDQRPHRASGPRFHARARIT